jgi:hypothetical protein
MKKAIISLLVSICCYNCSDKKQTLDFVTLNKTEFNAKAFFKIPDNKITDSLKKAHDSCMGFSFDANVVLIETKNNFFVGAIVNKQSLKTVNTISDLGITQDQLMSHFNVLTNPCYEKRVLHLPLKLLLGENFMLQFPGAGEIQNKEINDAIAASGNAEMETGSWVYLDIKDALKNILDTITSSKGLLYKKNLLDTANMVLTAVESVGDVSFFVNTEKNISASLQALLKSKPAVSQLNTQASMKVFYINNNKFQITINGFFPVVGQFMKAALK